MDKTNFAKHQVSSPVKMSAVRELEAVECDWFQKSGCRQSFSLSGDTLGALNRHWDF